MYKSFYIAMEFQFLSMSKAAASQISANAATLPLLNDVLGAGHGSILEEDGGQICPRADDEQPIHDDRHDEEKLQWHRPPGVPGVPV